MQAQIDQAAAQRGTDAQAFVLEATRRALEEGKFQRTHEPTTRSFGFLKGGTFGSDAFLADKHAEAAREREREREREKDEAINCNKYTPRS